eukprot:5204225-Karenia_brevis.AAC.1
MHTMLLRKLVSACSPDCNLVEHVYREHNTDADGNASRAYTDGFTCEENLTFTTPYLRVQFDGSARRKEGIGGAGWVLWQLKDKPGEQMCSQDWKICAQGSAPLVVESSTQAELIAASLAMVA